MDKLKEIDTKTAITAAAITTAALGAAYIVKRKYSTPCPQKGPYTSGTLPSNAYDVVIVGAGTQSHSHL